MLYQIKPRSYIPFKGALEGPAGGGKSRTLAEIAIGLWRECGSKLPIWWMDTEYKFAKTLAPFFINAKIPIQPFYSRSFVDLITRVQQAIEGGTDVFCVDSITHPFQDLTESFALDEDAPNCPNCRGRGRDEKGLICPRCAGRKKIPRRMNPAELGERNRQWQMGWGDAIIYSPCNIWFTGRVQTDFTTVEEEYTQNGETRTKLTLAATGKKMQAGRDTAYEPDLLMWMEAKTKNIGVQGEDKSGKKLQKITNLGTVLKDQSGANLQGKTIPMPGWKDVKPVWDWFQMAAKLMEQPQTFVGTGGEESTSLHQSPIDSGMEHYRRRKVALENIEGELTSIVPGQSREEKKWKVDALQVVFNTRSWTEIERLAPEILEAGLSKLKRMAEQAKQNIANGVPIQEVLEETLKDLAGAV